MKLDITSQEKQLCFTDWIHVLFIFQFQVAAYSLTSMFQGPHSVDFYMCPNTCIVSFRLVDGWRAEGTVVQFARFAQLQTHASL